MNIYPFKWRLPIGFIWLAKRQNALELAGQLTNGNVHEYELDNFSGGSRQRDQININELILRHSRMLVMAFRVMYSLSWFGSFSPLLPQCTGPSVSSLAFAWIMEANGSEQLQPVSVSPSPVPVPPGMDALILNGHAAERDEADPAKKKKKKKKKSKSAVSGECLIHSFKSSAVNSEEL